ncbi:MAG TPA: M13 family metallopeptidase [Steroidobacteraceae bacterium]
MRKLSSHAVVSLSILAALGACANSHRPAPAADSAPAPRQAQIGEFGLDLTSLDASVRPGDDFYRYAEGHWLDTHEIPPDRASWGAFDSLDEAAQQHVRELIEALPSGAPVGSAEQKVGDFYRAYMDTDAIDRAGLAPAQPGLDAIAKARTHEALLRLMGRHDLQLDSPIQLLIRPDEKNPDRYVVRITQSGLGLPDRDYYLKSEPVYADIRAKYQTHIERMLTLAGDSDAAAEAASIVQLETEIATEHWPAAKRRNLDLIYNLRTHTELNELAPGFAWQELLGAAGVDEQKDYVVRELDAVAAAAMTFNKVPVEVWQRYLRYHYLESFADVLPRPINEESFDFYGRTLNGQKVQRERWKLAVGATNIALGEDIGEVYVAHYFTPEGRAETIALVENMRAAYAQRIRAVSWMSDATKKVALEKLAKFRPKIGYPDKWRDYATLEIRSGDAFGNAKRAAAFDWQRQVLRINLPTDRDEWRMTPQTINAYYNPTFNEIVFPAAILQPPFFDPAADAAVNYGGIGGTIGHEMGHGFDDQGSKSDALGVLHTWWQPQDEAAFKQLVDRLAAQYDAFEALPGVHVNGRLTLGENTGDLEGLSVAYVAYHLSLRGRPAPMLAGLSGDQRFFLSWAQVWQAAWRDGHLRAQLLSNPHSPPRFRVNGAVRNVDAWYAAFKVQPSDRLYLPPEERVHIW